MGHCDTFRDKRGFSQTQRNVVVTLSISVHQDLYWKACGLLPSNQSNRRPQTRPKLNKDNRKLGDSGRVVDGGNKMCAIHATLCIQRCTTQREVDFVTLFWLRLQMNFTALVKIFLCHHHFSISIHNNRHSKITLKH